ncbi:hypothetical protein [Streptomyces lunalinharesii]|uniref:Uncharacterized protein n=1 Tax=Streptomyces lunalinharesii TaxID=333384 RepID=A0ABN3T7E0_9ACTN
MPRSFKDSEEAWIYTRNSAELAEYARSQGNTRSAELWDANAENGRREHLRLAADDSQG